MTLLALLEMLVVKKHYKKPNEYVTKYETD
jgi:hypothetical protein